MLFITSCCSLRSCNFFNPSVTDAKVPPMMADAKYFATTGTGILHTSPFVTLHRIQSIKLNGQFAAQKFKVTAESAE